MEQDIFGVSGSKCGAWRVSAIDEANHHGKECTLSDSPCQLPLSGELFLDTPSSFCHTFLSKK
jgi:hypothetical protein